MAPRVLQTQRSSRQSVPAAVLPESASIPSNKIRFSPAVPTTTDSLSAIPSNTTFKRQNGPIPIRAPRRSVPRTAGSMSHNPESISPSVAALLAMTAIPPLRKGTGRQASKRKPIQDVQSDDDFALLGGEDGHFEGPGFPLEMLLGSLDDTMTMERQHSVVSVRSDSSDSVPSLSGDNESLLSLTLPSTPGTRRPSMARKSRLSSEDCGDDHPLRPSTPPPSPPQIAKILSPPSRSTTLKSNLTASLRAIKSAAISLSAFAAPSIPPEDLLTRSLITPSPRLTDDRLPPSLPTTPSPSVRRYFNPPPAQTGLSLLFHTPAPEATYTVSIQLQEYARRPLSVARARVPAHRNSEAKGQQLLSDPALDVRQQGLRSNSDFVRVWCLTLAMHRAGKLSDSQLYRPQRGLAPRTAPQSQQQHVVRVEEESAGKVPRRWTSPSVNLDADRTKVVVRRTVGPVKKKKKRSL
ncbi:MAG: hypothetical protein M1814_003901 [Vezdaea aestivalis]|nr:MAG: hypothetical protein M1814_003901 [Vezdaea aestivalis]